MLSTVQQRGNVKFPEFMAERVYMREFTKIGGLPADLSRWQNTVDAMLDGIDAPGPIYIMVDQAEVCSGGNHRRPGVHIDGWWNPSLSAHGHPHPGHYHRPYEPEPRPHHIHAARHGHIVGEQYKPEALILATDVMSSYAYIGEWTGVSCEGGDCSHVDTSRMLRAEIEPGKVWAGDTMAFLHEAVPLRKTAKRTLVRLNVPGWIPN